MTTLGKSTETQAEAPEEYFESRATDVEVETEVLPSDEPEPWDPEKIRIHTKHYSLRQLVDMIADGDIDLAPDFQRHYVWKPRQRWSLIESLLLGIPLPSFYFNENTSGLLQVVDGVQRLTTIFQLRNPKELCAGPGNLPPRSRRPRVRRPRSDVPPAAQQRAVRGPCDRPADALPGEVRDFSAHQHRRESAQRPGDPPLHERP